MGPPGPTRLLRRISKRLLILLSRSLKESLVDNRESGDQFGVSAALEGDTVLIGARYDADNGAASGSAYVFRLVGPRAGDVDTSLVVAKDTGADITLSWDASCGPADTDYAIYEGIPGDFTSHASLFCGTDESTTKTFTPSADDAKRQRRPGAPRGASRLPAPADRGL